MNEAVEMDLIDASQPMKTYQAQMVKAQTNVIASATPADLLRIAVESNADLDRLERLMELQRRWEEKEAKRAYDAAFAAFKAEAVRILKGRQVSDGPLKGKSYAELHDVVNAVTPALSKHGLSFFVEIDAR